MNSCLLLKSKLQNKISEVTDKILVFKLLTTKHVKKSKIFCELNFLFNCKIMFS